MGELLLELGKMFKVGRVQDITTRLEQQLAEFQANSAHPQMFKRGSLNLSKINTNTDGVTNDVCILVLRIMFLFF